MKNLNLIIRKAARRWAERRKAECKTADHTNTVQISDVHAESELVASKESKEIQSTTSAQLSEQPAAVSSSESLANLTDNKNNPTERMNQTEQQLADFLVTHYKFRYNLLSDVTEYASVASSTGFKDKNRKMKRIKVFRPVTIRALISFCLAVHREGIPCWDRDTGAIGQFQDKKHKIDKNKKRRETVWVSHLFL